MNMENKTKTAVYCRVAKEVKIALYCRVDREDDEIMKIQEAMLRKFAKENYYSNVSVYADNGFNGLNFNRPAFNRLNEDISAGLIGTVIVTNISRISRNSFDFYNWIDNIRNEGVSFFARRFYYTNCINISNFKQIVNIL